MWRCVLVMCLLAGTAFADDFSDAIADLSQQDGLWTMYIAEHGGKVMAELPAAGETGFVDQIIYATALRTGLGSNPVGLDRGAGDAGRLITIMHSGDQVYFIADNLEYRADSSDSFERRATQESFASSIIWSTPVVARSASGTLLIDLGQFLARDSVGIAQRLKATGQGVFTLDKSRSVVPPEQLVFPDNLELEAIITLTSNSPGSEVRATAADPTSVSFAVHHSLVRLPAPGYKVREADARTATIDVTYYDMAQPLDQPLFRGLARRFRLEKTDPAAARSPVKKPIVFYIDRGAPEPVRSALIEGTRWWADAFDAAGFIDGFKVELLPEGAHPLDVRYNVVQWVHRQTRGWSYGGGIADPRTGEMIKARVTLGSQRVRQDRMIFEGLTSRNMTGAGGPNDPLEVALARIRQLAAHEVGHTLGFAHNMAASADGRASVMDYPAPLATLDGTGRVDLADAYAVGMGAWDLFTVKWLYSEFPEGSNEKAALDSMVDAAFASGLHYVADQHSRPVGAPHARGSLWDNGADPVASLDDVMQVRAAALSTFGADSIAAGQSLSDIQTVFAPIYLYHRYQVLAATKLIGGYEFDYRRAAGAADAVMPVTLERQRAALQSVTATLTPTALAIPPRISRLMSPPLYAWEPIQGRERIASQGGAIFDSAHAARVAAAVTLQGLLHPQRLARLEHTVERTLRAREVMTAASDAVLQPVASREQSIARLGATEVLVTSLIGFDGQAGHSLAARDAARAELNALVRRLSRGEFKKEPGFSRLVVAIDNYLDSGMTPESTQLPPAPEIPPGSPIGAETCWHCDSAAILSGSQ